MRQKLIVLAFSFLIFGFPFLSQAQTMSSDEELIYAYRPIIHQDCANVKYSETGTYSMKGDWLTPINYDGDWNTDNNWENLPAYFNMMPTPVVYTFIKKDSGYTFIGYLFYHPRDYSSVNGNQNNSTLNAHENDMEGCWIVIQNTGGLGTPLAMVTQAHNELWQYSWAGRATSGGATIDGPVDFNGTHPKVYIEAEGHGVYGLASQTNYGDGTQKLYNYTDYFTESFDRSSNQQGALINGSVFLGLIKDGDNAYVRMLGYTYGDHKAKVPWGWDADDGVLKGGLYLYPYYSATTMFNGYGL